MFQFGAEEIRGRNLDEVIAGREHIEEARSYTEETFKGVSVHGSSERRKKNGTSISVEFFGVPVIVDGQKAGAFGIYQDISGRKQAEEALRESEKRYRRLFENAADVIVVIGTDGTLFDVNERFEEESGYKREEMIGKNVFSSGIMTESSAKLAMHYLQKMLKGEPWPIFEIESLTKAENVIPYEIRAVPIEKSGVLTGVQATLRNITDRKSAEQALLESEERYRKVFDNVSDLIFTHDLDGRFITINRTTTEKLGYRADEMIGHAISEFMLPEYRELFYKDYLNGIRNRGFYEGISVYLDVKGEKHYIEYRNRLLTREGKESYVSGVGRDISERIQSQKEMQLLQKQVQYAQRMEAIGTLAGGIAHNFNNLLMGIQGYTSLMLLEMNSDHPFYKRLKGIEKQIQSGAKLTEQLLGYARQGRYEVKAVSLNQVVQETADTFGITRKDIKIHRVLATDLFGVKADKGQIEQVLLNLYVNAADAMPGGGSLYLETTNVTHEAMGKKPYQVKPGNYVLLTVKDTGKGMGEETLERIFEPFFTTKGLAKGTGLGLSSVYGILKSHGGYIDVESEKGHGSTFFVYLPASDEIISEEIRGDKQLVRGSETILFVDDEELVLDAAAQLIEKMGYTVLQAKSGSEAVEIYKINKEAIDLVILDLVMPEMGGGETYDRLREIDDEVKVLLSSGYSLNGDASEIMERGCSGFIQKPFKIEELSKKLRDILDER